MVGSVYNEDSLPPYALPTNRTVTAIRTGSIPSGSGGFNEIRFEDKAGSEQIMIHSADLRLDAPVTVQGALTVSSDAGSLTVVAPGDRYRDNSIRAWARIDSNGSVGTDEFGVSSVIRTATRNYVVSLDAAAASTSVLVPVAVAEVSAPPIDIFSLRVVSVQQVSTTDFNVYMNDGRGVSVDNAFTIVVTGR